MERAVVLVTGFEAFEAIADNPSAHVARELAARPPAGLDVRAAVLPVSFARSAGAFDAAFADGAPALVLALGVQSRGTGFRLEQRAARLVAGRPDVDGVDGGGLALGGARETELDLLPLAEALRAAGAVAVEVSSDAGGYVCERLYHHALGAAAARGVPAVFLHLPHADALPADEQAAIVRGFLPALVRATSGG
jgi:pyroglutamyl-peptidase